MKSFNIVTGRGGVAAAILLLALSLWSPAEARAQWASSGGNTTTPDKVGVGLTPGATPGAQLEVRKDQAGTATEVRVRNEDAGGFAGLYLNGGFTQGSGGFLQWNNNGAHKNLFLATGGNLPLRLGTNNTVRMSIDGANGRVGVGTIAPENQLHVEGGPGSFGAIRVSGAGGGFMNFKDAAAEPNARLYQWRSEGGRFRMTLINELENDFVHPHLLVATASGNVGFGTDSPANRLDVRSGSAGAAGVMNVANSDGTRYLTFYSGRSDNVGAAVIWDAAQPLRFGTGDISGATTFAERARLTGGGNFGIGTTAPLQRLQIGGNAPTATAAPDAISLGGTYSSEARANPKLRLYDDGANVFGAGVSSNQFDFVVPAGARYVWSVGGVEKMRVDGSGNVTVAGSISATYQDVAEWVPSTQKLAAGTVVVLDAGRSNHVLASASAYDTKVAGVVSAQPGVILGVAGEGKVMVATTGRVKVKVDATRGAIKVGDLLVTSGVGGFAMKSIPVDLGGTQIHRPGTIIGKALEPLEGGVGEILVLLSLQ